jgi:hypothetical protein
MSLEEFPKSIYMTSADPLMDQHWETHKLAEQELGESIPLIIVNNEAKEKPRMFTPQESLDIFKVLYPHAQIEIFTLETRERIAEYIQHADHVVRRKEEGLDSNSPYIQKIADVFEDPAYPQKVLWVDVSQHFPSNHTASRLKALISASLDDPDIEKRKIYKQKALKMAHPLLVEKMEEKLKERPELKQVLSITPDLQEFFEDIQKERQTADVL